MAKIFVGMSSNQARDRTAILRLRDSGASVDRMWFSARLPWILTLPIITLLCALRIPRRNVTPVLLCFSPLGCLTGALVSLFRPGMRIRFVFTGMGYLFTPGERRALRRIAKIVARNVFIRLMRARGRKVRTLFFVQNSSDKSMLVEEWGISDSKVKLIPGAGVPLDMFDCELENKQKIVLFCGRMIREKGAEDFYLAARILKRRYPAWRFLMAGELVNSRDALIGPREIESWASDSSIEWLGHVDDPAELIKAASIMCLPSYREGFPKVLMEGAAAQCALVAYDVPGCSDAIENFYDGFLVPPRSIDGLVEYIGKLIEDTSLRELFGRNALLKAGREFGIEKILDTTIIQITTPDTGLS